ncbi:MAG: PepSY domain-containing protein [Planctomycetaceae bacterium]|jgi:uncharacterized iron-regulated membrane protein|nr:PepSY domain-containing protein [Planctomycetaceae bacterium]
MLFRVFRRFFYEVHLWLGIVSGIVVFIVCLSGAILVFREDVQHLAEPAKYYVNVPKDADRLPVDKVIAKLEADNPGMKVTSVTIPEPANRTISAMLSNPRPQGEQPRGERPEGMGRRGQRPDGEQPQGERPEGAEGRRQRSDGEQRPQGERPEGTEGRRQRSDGEQRPQGERGRQEQAGQNRGGAPQGGPGGRSFGKMVLVNPYTAEVVAEGGGRNSGGKLGAFFMSMQQLHRNLWISYRIESLGPRSSLGGLIVGIATIIFVVTVLSGLVLWFPRTLKSWKRWASWKQGLIVKFRSGIWRFIYDSHNTVGFYMLIPTLILALTGLCWSFGWYRNTASYVLGDQVFKQRMQRPEKIIPLEGGTQPLSVGELIERQNKLTPGSGEISVSIPNDRETALVIQKGRTGFFALSLKDKTQWDRFRGTVIPVEHFGKTVEVERFADKPFGAKIAAAVRTLHFGDVTGTSSKILFFIACLFAASFPITGVMLWTRKLIARYRKRPAKTGTEVGTEVLECVDLP